MRSYEEFKQILELWESGVNKKAISRITHIPRRTVIDCIQRYGNLETLQKITDKDVTPLLLQILKGDITGDYAHLHSIYAYVLGLYLGDGHIVKVRNVYQLRIFCDAKYHNLIDTIVKALKTLIPNNQVGMITKVHQDKPSCVVVNMYHRDMPLFFPQHGDGKKHDRKIELHDWQKQIVTAHPIEFLRGLYHSDGSRFDNIVNGKAYPRYQFTNGSTDIIQIFCSTCDQLGIHWTSKFKPPKTPRHHAGHDIFISRRKDVAYLDSVIGAKS